MKQILLSFIIALAIFHSFNGYGQSAAASNATNADTVQGNTSYTPSGFTNIIRSEDDIILYPNPATDEVNVVYNTNSGVKTIAIYNIIGKALKVYNTLDNSSAKLNIENVPAGIYFMRLMDAQGHIVATRRFTRQ